MVTNRCEWGQGDPLYMEYHDSEWGVPLHDDRELELLTRPGVFSPGRLDPGTKALLGAFTASPGELVLELLELAGGILGFTHLGFLASIFAGFASTALMTSSNRPLNRRAPNFWW